MNTKDFQRKSTFLGPTFMSEEDSNSGKTTLQSTKGHHVSAGSGSGAVAMFMLGGRDSPSHAGRVLSCPGFPACVASR